MHTLLHTAKRLALGQTTSEQLVEEALARIDDPAGEGARVFTRVYHDAAREFARAADRARARGVTPSPLAGIPVSVKDLFDVRGEPTTAASRALARSAPAGTDATIVARLRAAGAIIVGRTNMTEFAYSGIGVNPHYGTPRNPFERTVEFEHRGVRARGRSPGGSSSGAAVSVADRMALVGIGTDTGGSVRIPAAVCGVTGFKPTSRRVPREGAYPLSTTLDSVGPLAPSVACCVIADAVMAGDAPTVPAPLAASGLRLGVIRDFVADGLEPAVAAAYDRALSALGAAGARLTDVPFPELARIPQLSRVGGIVGAEAYAHHRHMLVSRRDQYDPRVARRLLLAESVSAADYIDLLRVRADLIARASFIAMPYDALLAPAVPIIAPPIVAMENDDEAFGRMNGLILRNTSLFNFLDCAALSIPCHRAGEAPVGLMVIGAPLTDARVLAAGLAIETIVAPQPLGGA